MKNRIIVPILLIGLISFFSCTQKNVEGVVISVPMSLSLNELMSGEVSNMTFTGDAVTVRLNDGEEVEALATNEQMEQAFEGKNIATLEKIKDPEHEGVNWKIVKLEENTEQKDIIFEDDHIGIKLDKIEKADTYPSEWKVPGQRYPSPREDYVYLVVYFKIELIRDIHVVSFGGRNEEKSVLHNGNGKQYGLFTWNAKGWEFLDPGSLSSPSELVKGATGIMIFEIPAQENPAELSFVYYFKETWDDEQRQKGELNIDWN